MSTSTLAVVKIQRNIFLFDRNILKSMDTVKVLQNSVDLLRHITTVSLHLLVAWNSHGSIQWCMPARKRNKSVYIYASHTTSDC